MKGGVSCWGSPMDSRFRAVAAGVTPAKSWRSFRKGRGWSWRGGVTAAGRSLKKAIIPENRPPFMVLWWRWWLPANQRAAAGGWGRCRGRGIGL